MCYIWLESYGCVDSHYQLLNNVPGTRLAPDFCQQFGTQIITPSETLSYIVMNLRHHHSSVTFQYIPGQFFHFEYPLDQN